MGASDGITPLQRWFKLLLGGVAIVAAVVLIVGRSVYNWPVTYGDIAILMAIGGALLQLDFGKELAQNVWSGNAPPPPPQHPPYKGNDSDSDSDSQQSDGGSEGNE